jgi:hypothetical protein
VNKNKNLSNGLRRLPRVGDRLLWQVDSELVPMVVLEIMSHGNFAKTIAIRDERKRVFEVRKEELCKPDDIDERKMTKDFDLAKVSTRRDGMMHVEHPILDGHTLCGIKWRYMCDHGEAYCRRCQRILAGRVRKSEETK